MSKTLKVKKNKNQTLNTKTAFVTIAAVLSFAITAFLIYFYGFVRPGVIADYNSIFGNSEIMTVFPSEKKDTILDSEAVTKFTDIPQVSAVSPLLTYPAEIVSRNVKGETVVYGVMPKYFGLEEISVDYGRPTFSGDKAAEAIVSMGAMKPYLEDGPQSILGKSYDVNLIKIDQEGNTEEKSIKLKVVGISADENTKFLYAPINVVNVFDSNTYSRVKISAKNIAELSKIRKQVEPMGYPITSTIDSYQQIIAMTRYPWTYYFYFKKFY